MQNDYTSKKFKKWLDKLQQESWQLELIVSGFVIFGLFQSIDPLLQWTNQMQIESDFSDAGGFIGMFGMMLVLSVRLLLFNLIIHLVLRGLWIGAIGLRYYSGDIDFKELKYSEKFDSYLKRKIVSFDRYISRLEDWCSIIFSLSFFLVFVFISFAIILGGMILIMMTVVKNFEPSLFIRIPFYAFIFLYFLMLLLTLVDFLGQGILKKNKWISKVYFPLYRVMSYLSLSFLYRPILYNFLDHKKGKRILFWMIPFYILVGMVGNMHFSQSNFHTADNRTAQDYLESSYYLTNYNGEEIERRKASYAIESLRMERTSMRLFLFHSSDLEDAVVKGQGSINPKVDKRGFKTIYLPSINRMDSSNTLSFKKYIAQLNEDVIVYIDSVRIASNFVANKLPNKQLGYEMYLDLNDLNRGKHIISIVSKKMVRDSIAIDKLQTIPFWYYPE